MSYPCNRFFFPVGNAVTTVRDDGMFRMANFALESRLWKTDGDPFRTGLITKKCGNFYNRKGHGRQRGFLRNIPASNKRKLHDRSGFCLWNAADRTIGKGFEISVIPAVFQKISTGKLEIHPKIGENR